MVAVIMNANEVSEEQRRFLDWHCRLLAPQVKRLLASSSIPIKIRSFLRMGSVDHRLIDACVYGDFWMRIQCDFDSALLSKIETCIHYPEELGYPELGDDFTHIYYYSGAECIQNNITEMMGKKKRTAVEEMEQDTKKNLLTYLKEFMAMLNTASTCPPTYLDTSSDDVQPHITHFKERIQKMISRLINNTT